jgi:hypothetical protein
MIVNRFKSILKRVDHILLLGSLLFLVASPIWEEVVHGGIIWSELATILIVISGLSVTYSQLKKRVNFKFVFGVFTIIVSLIEMLVDIGGAFNTIVQYSQLGFFFMLNLIVLNLIIQAKEVDSSVMVNSISGYLLMGFSWAIILGLWVRSYPHSFSFSIENGGLLNEIYYVFVTMTTLGYGDYLPVTAPAKAFSILISVTGAFYTTIVLGMIVGKYISNETLNQVKNN